MTSHSPDPRRVPNHTEVDRIVYVNDMTGGVLVLELLKDGTVMWRELDTGHE